jgi:3'-phosphoadenosine 5'-phosphosulfate (PAPS) 3'-phosphatase
MNIHPTRHVCKRDRSTRSKYVTHSKLKIVNIVEGGWDLYKHLISLRIFTMTGNKIFM